MKAVETDIKLIAQNLESQSKLLTEAKSPKLDKVENLCEKLIAELAETKTYASICSSKSRDHVNIMPKSEKPELVGIQEALTHSETPITDIKNNFLDKNLLNKLEEYLQSELNNGKFVKTDGYSVLNLG